MSRLHRMVVKIYTTINKGVKLQILILYIYNNNLTEQKKHLSLNMSFGSFSIWCTQHYKQICT